MTFCAIPHFSKRLFAQSSHFSKRLCTAKVLHFFHSCKILRKKIAILDIIEEIHKKEALDMSATFLGILDASLLDGVPPIGRALRYWN